MRKIFSIVLTLVILIILCVNTSYAYNPARKFGRGVSNVATGWMEVPATISDTCEEHGYIAGWLMGIPVGLARAAMRTVVGVYEAVTFPLPIPKDYAPVMEPEFVIGSPMESMD